MKQKTHTSYWFLAVVLILLFALVACTRPAPQPDPDELDTPITQPTPEQLPTPVPSSPTPLPAEPNAGDTAAETEPPTAGSTEPVEEGNAAETEPTTPEQNTTHMAQTGETLTSISQLYGVSVEQLAVANNLTISSELVAGQTLIIPAADAAATVPDEQAPEKTESGEIVHIVQPGENLFRISLRYGKTVAEVAAHNGIANPHYIYPGQEIRIP
ncbi:MAG: hypothetical protein CSB13_01975 [Chloroflexi bacterium]|nr:MAG: hypothetical protein CSB13_01975 [Chloroflexota bacterium]